MREFGDSENTLPQEVDTLGVTLCHFFEIRTLDPCCSQERLTLRESLPSGVTELAPCWPLLADT